MKKALIAVGVAIFAAVVLCACIIGGSASSVGGDLPEQIAANMQNYTYIDHIPQDLKNAVIATEDKRFYQHPGFDVLAMARAFCVNIQSGSLEQGGSTITQQLAKNLFLTNEKSLQRKLSELYYTIGLEYRYSKDQILEMYLNVIYYGSGIYGVENASEAFYHKRVENLSLEECAMLAGIPQSPNNYNPNTNPREAQERQKMVLERMSKCGFLSKSGSVKNISIKATN